MNALKLRAAPAFVQAFAFDGRPYIAKDAEPYTQFWLSERERLLLALFARRGGMTEAEACAACLRGSDAADTPAEQRRLARAVAGMRAAGVLIGASEDSSRYSAAIVDDYLRHRPIPPAIVDCLVQQGGVAAATRVLDLAGGPGELALALARHSKQVALMELSKGFLASARRRAKAQGVPLTTLHDSCNRLVYRDEPSDLISVCQALHWLDDVMVCRGVCRLLSAGGSFFVVHSAIELDAAHPLAYLLGNDSILGRKPPRPFKQEVQALHRRLALLFEALDAGGVDRLDPTRGASSVGRIVPAGVRLFHQRRPFGPGYARGFLTPQHIAVTGQGEAEFWADLHARCEGSGDLTGSHHWAVLQFRRAGPAGVTDWRRLRPEPLAYDGPAET